MILYGPMFTEFMSKSDANTSIGKETCGVLAGVEVDNILYVTTLIIPKQQGSSDSVVTTHEDEIFAYQESNNLLTFGWIHTHPTHDLFLSSVDVHTHYAYQSMLPEAVAIVVAPKRTPNFGIFKLTDPYGMQIIADCPLRSFHPHYQTDIFTRVCEHVSLDWKSKVYNVVDQRRM